MINAGGGRNETSITFAFANLLRSYFEKRNLLHITIFHRIMVCRFKHFLGKYKAVPKQAECPFAFWQSSAAFPIALLK
jgi:hypothetical protein